MITVQQLVEQWCQKQRISAQSVEGRVSFSVEGANGSFPAAVLPLEEDRAIVCLFGVGIFVPEDLRDAAAQQLVDINFPLKLGSVHLNRETGELSFRVVALLPEEETPAAALVERVLLLSAHAMDQLLQVLLRLCYS